MEIKELENKIINADCLDILKQLPDKCVDLVLTDPPYGTTACSWDKIIPFNELWKQIERIRKDDCAVVLFGQEPFSSYLRISNIKEYKYDWIWEKQKASNFMSMKKQPARYHELISVFYKHKYFPIMWEVEKKIIEKQ
jgi:site-specific DNA-methyltransferase (adenine-specific)